MNRPSKRRTSMRDLRLEITPPCTLAIVAVSNENRSRKMEKRKKGERRPERRARAHARRGTGVGRRPGVNLFARPGGGRPGPAPASGLPSRPARRRRPRPGRRRTPAGRQGPGPRPAPGSALPPAPRAPPPARPVPARPPPHARSRRRLWRSSVAAAGYTSAKDRTPFIVDNEMRRLIATFGKPVAPARPSSEPVAMLTNTFCHLPGVGEKTERRLWSAGVTSWDLADQQAAIRLPRSVKESWARHI